MHIAFLTPEYPHPKVKHAAGIGTSVFGLVEALNSLGHDVSVLVYGQKKDEVFIEEGIQFYLIKNIKVKGLSLFLTQRKVERLINRLIREQQIDIVEAPDWTGFSSFLKINCPLIIKEHGSDTYFCHLEERPVKFKNKFLEKRAISKADGLISVSRFTGTITNKLMGLSKSFKVIPNGVNIDLFTPNHRNSNKLTVLYFGTLIRKKGLFELPLIFNEVNKINQEIELVLVGGDSTDVKTGKSSTWDLIKPLFNDNAIKKVNYLGVVPHNQISPLIESATVCVFPSFAEAFPVSWLEAMAMKKAIVASNVGWANEMIEDGREGYLVHPKNHIEFADRILEIILDKLKQENMGKAAREKVENSFSHLEIAKTTVEFYKQVIQKKI